MTKNHSVILLFWIFQWQNQVDDSDSGLESESDDNEETIWWIIMQMWIIK